MSKKVSTIRLARLIAKLDRVEGCPDGRGGEAAALEVAGEGGLVGVAAAGEPGLGGLAGGGAVVGGELLVEDLGDHRLGGAALHQVGGEAAAAEGLLGQAAGHEVARGGQVVEVLQILEASDGRFDLLLLVAATQELVAELGREVGSARQQVHRLGEGGGPLTLRAGGMVMVAHGKSG